MYSCARPVYMCIYTSPLLPHTMGPICNKNPLYNTMSPICNKNPLYKSLVMYSAEKLPNTTRRSPYTKRRSPDNATRAKTKI